MECDNEDKSFPTIYDMMNNENPNDDSDFFEQLNNDDLSKQPEDAGDDSEDFIILNACADLHPKKVAEFFKKSLEQDHQAKFAGRTVFIIGPLIDSNGNVAVVGDDLAGIMIVPFDSLTNL